MIVQHRTPDNLLGQKHFSWAFQARPGYYDPNRHTRHEFNMDLHDALCLRLFEFAKNLQPYTNLVVRILLMPFWTRFLYQYGNLGHIALASIEKL